MRVLIADFDGARNQALTDACTARGYLVERAAHGAKALETALERVPDVVICPIDLPVIDGVRLSEILRGNPRLRHASFIFLVKDELDAPMAMDPRDGIVVSPWLEEDVLEHIDAVLERNTRFGDTRPESEIEGKLSQISVVDLLQMFQMNQKTGTIRIFRIGTSQTGTILVRGGQVTDASIPLSDGASVVGEKALYRLFMWRDGRFEFVPGPVADGGRIRKPSRALLLEGMRQLDEWEKLRKDVPHEDTRLVLTRPRSDIPTKGHPIASEVVDAVEAYRRVRQIVDHCASPDYQVLRVLHDMLQHGLLALETGTVTADGPVAADGLFTSTQLRRLREWAASRRPRQGAVLKVLVIAADRSVVADFYESLRACPDFMSDARLVRLPDRVGGLGSLGHIGLGEGMSLRLICVPADPDHKPLWDVVAHGMLGAIVLPTGAIGAALEQTEAAFQHVLSLRPRAVVHVITQRAGGPGLSDEARAQVGSLAGGGVFVLPAADATPVLRNALARLVP